MISPSAQLSIARLPLSKLIVTEYQPRYFDRLKHYYDLMSRPEYANHAPGFLCVKPREDGYYELLDGHHRYAAHIMTGRAEALCLIIDESRDAQAHKDG